MTAKKQTQPEASINVMLVDDDPMVRRLISKYLEREGYNIEVYEDAEKALGAFKEVSPDVVISDIHLPKMSGLELLTEIKKLETSAEVIMISGDADKSAAIEALHSGAFDMFEKPIDLKMISATLHRTVRYQEAVRKCSTLGAQVEMLTSRENERFGIAGFIGTSKAVQDVLNQVQNLQKNDKISVLIRGESGTGKELISNAIHYGSSRSSAPIVPVNCSAIPDELAESTFFGHTKGSFTGATADKKGCFETADGGTLFLDEIGDMLPAIQIKLLRVLEDEVIVPVGATKGRKVNVRIIAATNANLEEKVKDGTFREDLYYRLARFTINMPPLRDRKEDVPQLVDHFVTKISDEMGHAVPAVTKDFTDALMNRNFSGNVRELRNIIEHAMILCSGEELTLSDLQSTGPSQPPASMQSAYHSDIPENLKEAEAWLIRRAIDMADGNISEAARKLGITRAKIYRYK